jgi:hypothetical protein
MREDPVTAPTADFPEAQCLHEAHKVIEAGAGLALGGGSLSYWKPIRPPATVNDRQPPLPLLKVDFSPLTTAS